MKQILIYIVAAIALLAMGFGGGWHAKGVSVAAGQTKTAKAETVAVVADVKKQVATQQVAAKVEQGKSQALAADQQSLRDHGAAIQQEIDHVVFVYPKPKPDAGIQCPNPLGTTEFVRLYDSAARGKPEAAGPVTTR